MRNQPGIRTSSAGSLTVLSVSPMEEDHSSLETILGLSEGVLFKADHLKAGRAVLQQHDISVIICDRDLMPGTWIEMLEHSNLLPQPPLLIVASRLADERLWAEALNRGAWDVLARPFDCAEVLRSIKVAWEHRRHQIEIAARQKRWRAAG